MFKYKFTLPALLIFALGIYQYNLKAQWIHSSLPFPGGGYITSITTGEKFIAAGTNEHGVYISYDKGNNWKYIGLKNDILTVSSLAIDDTIIYAASSFGLYRTTNMGKTWIRSDSVLSDWYVNPIAVCGKYVLALGQNNGVYRSSDNGESWAVADSEFIGINGRGLAVDDSIVFVNTKSGMFRSTDYGMTWAKNDTGLSVGINTMVIKDSIIYAGSSGTGVFLSTNNGNSWTEIDSGLSNKNVNQIVIADSEVFLGTGGGGIFSSKFGSAHWDNLLTNIPYNYIYSMAKDSSGIYAGTSGGGIYKSTDNGLSWNSINKGLTAIEINAFTVQGNTIFGGAYEGLFVSSDNGINWFKTTSGLVNSNINALHTAGTNIIAGTFSGIFTSTDGGNSWDSVASPYTNYYVYTFSNDGSKIYAGTTKGLLQSTDNGITWQERFPLENCGALTVKNGILYAGSMIGGGVFAFSGQAWSLKNNGLTNKFVESLETVGDKLIVNTQGGEFYSSDNGNTWLPVDTANSIGIINSVSNAGSNIICGTNKGLFRSTDNGDSWLSIDSGLTDKDISSIAVNNRSIFIGTKEGGVWRNSLNEIITDVKQENKIQPLDYSLMQNYPNPFNPTTNITFSIPAKAHVIIELFNILGEKVSTILSKEMETGSYKIQWQGSNFPSGIYFYRMKANDFIQTKKLVLIK